MPASLSQSGDNVLCATHLLDLKMNRDAICMWPAEGDTGVKVVIQFELGFRASPWRGTHDAGKAGRDGKESDRQDGVVTPLL